MANHRLFIFLVSFSASLFSVLNGQSQPYSSIELVKPKPYEDRPLMAEKTGGGKVQKDRYRCLRPR